MDNRVFVAKCSDYNKASEAVNRVLDAFGGASAILDASTILGGGKRVLVKPNVLMPVKPEDAATTHPAVIEAVCAAFVKAGAEVSIIDSTGGPHTKIVLKLLYGKTGAKKAAKQSGAKLSFDTSARTVTYPEGKTIQTFDLISPALDADLVITCAKAKTHGFMTMTGCVKNLFGCVPGLHKPRMHRRFPERKDFAAMLVDVCSRVNPGFSILDAVYGMEGAGPTGGEPKYLGAILGGFSPYAVDLAQSSLMGFRADIVWTIQEAAMRGYAPDDPSELHWLGDDPEPLRTAFKPAIRNKKYTSPKIMKNCSGCGDCERICPMSCITIRNRVAVINENECIRCYVCHEFCPAKAISLE